jgi:drug/metabolite transporter (DMT)-like permease
LTLLPLPAVFFNWISALFLSSPFPFRAQIVSVSLLLGVVLLVQPTPLFPDQLGFLTIPASPIDLPPIGDYSLDIPLPLAYFAASVSAFFMVISLGLLSRAVKISIYHSISSNSLLTAVSSLVIYSVTRKKESSSFDMPSTTQVVLSATIIGISLLAHLFQALALQRKSPRQLSLVSYIQPIFSTGLQTVFLDHSIDVLPIAGSVLIAANVWVPPNPSYKTCTSSY